MLSDEFPRLRNVRFRSIVLGERAEFCDSGGARSGISGCGALDPAGDSPGIHGFETVRATVGEEVRFAGAMAACDAVEGYRASGISRTRLGEFSNSLPAGTIRAACRTPSRQTAPRRVDSSGPSISIPRNLPQWASRSQSSPRKLRFAQELILTAAI